MSGAQKHKVLKEIRLAARVHCLVATALLETAAVKTMTALWQRLIREDAGQDLIEYGLMVGLITAALVTTITTVGGKVQGYFTTLNAILP